VTGLAHIVAVEEDSLDGLGLEAGRREVVAEDIRIAGVMLQVVVLHKTPLRPLVVLAVSAPVRIGLAEAVEFVEVFLAEDSVSCAFSETHQSTSPMIAC